MTIYLTYSTKLHENIVARIEDIVRKLGYEIAKRCWPEGDGSYTAKEGQEVFDKNVKNIHYADIVIAESSFASMGVGYEISLAIEQRKPVVVLYNMEENLPNNKESWAIPPHIKGNSSKYLIVKEYKMRMLEKILELGLKDAKTMVNTKFLLIIPHDIDVYLEWCVKDRGMTKAAATREALKMMMKYSEDFNSYLNSKI